MKLIKGKVAFIFLIFATMAETLVAQQIDRSQRPEADLAPEISFPPYTTFILDNGLKVFFVEDPRPLVTMRLLVRGGNAVAGEQTGLGDAVADLLTKGSGENSAQKFAEKIDFVGGSILASASEDAISLRASGLKKYIEAIAGLFAQVILEPRFPETELTKYKALQIDGLEASKKQADFIADYAVSKVLYGNAPFARMPTKEDINSISRDALLDYHKTSFSPKNSTLALVGNFSPEEAKEFVEKYFADWKSASKAPQLLSGGVKIGNQKIVLVDRPTSVQSAVRIVGPGPGYTDHDRTRAFLVNSIFGGGTGLGNRLAMNLRETHGWTYSPYSYFTANLFGGSFVAAADVRNSVTDSAIGEIIRELERMVGERVLAEELNLNVQSSVGNYLMSLANPERTAARVQNIDFYGLPSDYYDKLVDVYTTTTADDILGIARKYFQKEDMAVVVVGKASEIREDLERFGEVTLWNEDLEPIRTVSATQVGIDANDAWEKMLDAMGGKAQLQSVTALSMEGAAVLNAGPQKLQGTYKMVQAYRNKEFVELTAQFSGQSMTLFQKFTNETTAAQIQQGQKIPMSDEDVQKQIAAAHIMVEAWLNELKGGVELQGLKEIDGVEYLVVEVNREGVDEHVYYIHSQTFLPYRIEAGETVVIYSDWKEIDGGIMQPDGLTIQFGQVEIGVSNISYTVNGTVDEKIFQAP